MTTIETTKGKWLFVEVPGEAKNFAVEHNWKMTFDTGKCERTKAGNIIDMKVSDFRFLGKGNYDFIATTSTITEEQAKEIVEAHHIDQTQFKCYWDFKVRIPIESHSFNSLLKANNLTAPNYAILKVL